mgnify:CR=1 FL=1
MSLTATPRSNRLHIVLLGKRNSGKSSLLNALTHQQAALVSDVAGTTTDPVYQAMEVHGLGPCVFIDTAGFDDEGELGALRVEKTLKVMQKADVALLVCRDEEVKDELHWLQLLKEKQIPTLLVLNKADLLPRAETVADAISKKAGMRPLIASARTGEGVETIREALIRMASETVQPAIVSHLVSEGDLVLLVMPQDIQAPKGRLILPQVQTLRELLDRKCMVMSCTTDKLQASLQALVRPPKLIITDSQVFPIVYQQKPAESSLTSFSVLFAGYKGDINAFVEGAAAIHSLTPQSRVLIAEACTHAPLTEDIGTVKIPRLLRKRIGEELQIDFVSGNDFPKDLFRYDLIIHCGACMFNRKYVLNRIAHAHAQHIPITNYGVAIASLTGILDKIVIHR